MENIENNMIEILTGILVLITAFYAWATYRMLKANEKVIEVMNEQKEAEIRPYIIISPATNIDNPMFYLNIINTGKTSAHNLKLTLDKAFYKNGIEQKDKELKKYEAFNKVIASFHPGQKLIISLAKGPEIFSVNANPDLIPKSFSVVAEYSFNGKTVQENNIIDLNPYRETTIPQDTYASRLKEIATAIKNQSKA